MIRIALIAGALLASGVAQGQGLDAAGPTVLPADGDPARPLRVASPWRLPPGAVALGIEAGWDQGSLVQRLTLADAEQVQPLVDHATGLNVSGVWAPHERVRIAGSLPFRWTLTGDPHARRPVLGDVALAAEASLLHTRAAQVAVTPWVRLPTGDAGRHAGTEGPRLGGVFTGAWHGDGVHAAAEAGFESQPATDLAAGGVAVRAGAALTWQPTDLWGIGLESRASIPLSDEMRRDRGVPAELIASGRFRPGRWWAHAGVGHSLSTGAGSPVWSAFAGGGATFGPRRPAATLAVRTLATLDPDGRPVRGATVHTGAETLGETDASGLMSYTDGGGLGSLTVEAPGLQPVTVRAPFDDHTEVRLEWAPVLLYARAVDVQGTPVDATFQLTGGGSVALTPSGVGRGWATVAPGRWIVLATAPGMGSQERTVVIAPGRAEAMHVDAVLHPAAGDGTIRLSVTDPDGRPVEGAQVLLDGASVGTTSSGGDLVIAALAAREHALQIAAESHEPTPERSVRVPATGTADVEVGLGFAPGTVRIVAVGPDGVVVDGQVRLQGAIAMAPMPLGEDGERLVVLEPGRWTATLSSPSFGMQERVFEVLEDGPVPLEVRYTMQPAQAGGSDLLVRVHDRDARPVAGAEVIVDGVSCGYTANGGLLRLHDLRAGTHGVQVRHAAMRVPAPIAVQLTGAVREVPVVLDWRPGMLRVRVAAASLQTGQAVVRLSGPTGTRTWTLDDSGTRLFQALAPGTWEVLASAPDHGMQARTVEISADAGSLAEVDITLQRQTADGGQLHISVADPDGRPVQGADVVIDGRPMGTTSTAGEMTVWGVQVGLRDINASGAGVDCGPVRAIVTRDQQGSATVRCQWAPGLVHVRVVSARGPVTDALIRATGPGTVVVPVGLDGGRTLELQPGDWQILVSSPTAGMAERSVHLSAERGRRVVELTLGQRSDNAQLLTRLVDDRGQPVAGISVHLDGEDAGRTRADGTLFVAGRTPGDVIIQVQSPAFHPVQPIADTLPPGPTEILVEVRWKPVPVPVSLRGPDGAPLKAEVSAVGPTDVPSTTIDGDGTLYVPPGDWRVVATAPRFAASIQPLHVGTTLPPEPVRFDLAVGYVELAADALRVREVLFEVDQDTPSAAYDSLLAEVAALLLAHPSILRLEVQGHTDTTGTVPYNMSLSHRRADGIRQALIASGVPRDRLQSRGYGPTRPIADNAAPAGRAANRRVEFVILEAGAVQTP